MFMHFLRLFLNMSLMCVSECLFISCCCFQALLEQRRRQEEKEMREAAAQRRKDMEEERLARERVKAQLEQDKLDKRVKFQVIFMTVIG